MKSVSLRGPFAYYERKAAEDDRRIADLETEVRQRLAENSQLNQQLSQQVAENKRLQDTSKAQGEAQEKAQAIIGAPLPPDTRCNTVAQQHVSTVAMHGAFRLFPLSTLSSCPPLAYPGCYP